MNAAARAGDLRNYALVTAAYWADTITDGAIRVLVLFYFYQLGYSPLEVASAHRQARPNRTNRQARNNQQQHEQRNRDR